MIWKSIPGFSDYEASDEGQIRRIKGGRRKTLPYLSKQAISSNGYYVVTAYDDNGARQRPYVHRLVASAFYGSPSDGKHVAHGDGTRTNNCIENLRWASMSENQMDRVGHGTSNRGENHGMGILTETEVRRMRDLRASGMSYPRIAKAMGVKVQTCYYAASGRNWKYLD